MFFSLPKRKTLRIHEHWLRSQGLGKTHGAEHDFSVLRPVQAYRPSGRESGLSAAATG
jgi:hypothetical protein